jgi:hypothetical protein
MLAPSPNSSVDLLPCYRTATLSHFERIGERSSSVCDRGQPGFSLLLAFAEAARKDLRRI